MTATDEKHNRPAGTRARLQRLAWLMDKSIRLLRNIRLLESHLNAPGPTRKQSRWVIAAAFLVLASVAVTTVTIVIMPAQFLWTMFTA